MTAPSDRTEGGPEASGPDSTIDAPRVSEQFTDLMLHARGGLGEVFRATDAELHRTVAIKYLQDRHAQKPDRRQRFLMEAEMTARLEHPGVVPVYGLVNGGDRPAYAMRFVEGNTFAAEIAEYHAAPPDPVAFRRLLQSFLQVCQTVAYAHSRGVIHRDLKPANVMIGKFGETLLVDWGLAKIVGRPEEVRAAGAGETLIPSSESVPSETEMGSAVGTPAYMSPEQAAGRWDVVAQASDVYGLGAMLYTVLTSKPPLERGNWPEMQQRIQQGDFPWPRQIKPDVPRPLEAICLKAMSVKLQERYASAESLAAEIEHWLADEPVIAYPEPFTTRARRWGKQHRAFVSAALVLLVAAVMGLSVGTVLLQHARQDTENQRLKAVAAQNKAEALNRFLVDDLLKQADPSNNPVGDKITVLQLLDKSAARLDEGTILKGQPEIEAELRSVIGHAYEYLSLLSKAERHYRRAWELLDSLHGRDHRTTLAIRNRFVYALVNQRISPEVEPAAVDAYDRCTRLLGDNDPETAEAANNLAEIRLLQLHFDEAIALRRLASRIANATLGPLDNKTLEIDSDLAVALVRGERQKEAAPLLQDVVARRKQSNPNHPEYPKALSNLGGALIALEHFREAEETLAECIRLSEAANGKYHPVTLSCRNLHAYTLEGQQKWPEAEAEYLGVISDRQKPEAKEAQVPQSMGRSFAFTARLYAKQREWPQAANYLAKVLSNAHPNSNRTSDALVKSLEAVLTDKADPTIAEALLRETWDDLKPITWAGDWLVPEIASRYGDALRRQGKYAEAEPILKDAAVEIQQRAVGVPKWSVAESRRRVADLYDAWKKPQEAVKWR